MDTELLYLKMVFLNCIVLSAIFAGCVEAQQKQEEPQEVLTQEMELDKPSSEITFKQYFYTSYINRVINFSLKVEPASVWDTN